jgi:hypothetical protein
MKRLFDIIHARHDLKLKSVMLYQSGAVLLTYQG